jgi:hypothetical protein
MKNMLCKYQETLFSNNEQIRISRCGNSQCPRLYKILSPEICEACSFRVEPTPAEIRGWQLKFAESGDEGDERPAPVVEQLFNTYCSKCAHYNQTSLTCDVCNCPGSQHPVKERMRLEVFHCPLNLW